MNKKVIAEPKNSKHVEASAVVITARTVALEAILERMEKDKAKRDRRKRREEILSERQEKIERKEARRVARKRELYRLNLHLGNTEISR